MIPAACPMRFNGIFQENIQQVCNNEQELIDQVRKTVLHEIGHHFGLNEDDLERLGYG